MFQEMCMSVAIFSVFLFFLINFMKSGKRAQYKYMGNNEKIFFT